MRDLSKAIGDRRPLAVGSIADSSTLFPEIGEISCDLVELRLDGLGGGEQVRSFARAHHQTTPLLLTARNPAEGGQNDLDPPSRAALFEDFLEFGTLLDLELRSLDELSGIWTQAEDRGLIRIASYHNFETCPPLEELQERVQAMAEAGADVAKLAFHMSGPDDLSTLIDLLRSPSPLPLAAMGMGSLAPSSRLLAVQMGSVLNYGYLGQTATAPGQWPVGLLKEAIEHSQSA